MSKKTVCIFNLLANICRREPAVNTAEQFYLKYLKEEKRILKMWIFGE